eukprot:m.171101 g.171101  ORF g.171101 m.171101 type:complete len:1002 (+) comp13334_c0_seq1:312-3317(+)
MARTVTWLGLLAVYTTALVASIAADADPSTSLYCQRSPLVPNTERCCFNDGSCSNCYDVGAGQPAVVTPLAGTWTVVTGTAKAVKTEQHLPASTKSKPASVLLLANNMDNHTDVASSVIQFSNTTGMNFGAQLNTWQYGGNNTGELTITSGQSSDVFVWQLQILQDWKLFQCLQAHSAGPPSVFKSFDLTMGGKVDVTKATFTITMVESNSMINVTVTSGSNIVGKCGASISNTSPTSDGTDRALIIGTEAGEGENMGAVIANVQVSDNLLPPRTSSSLGKQSQPMVIGQGVALHYMKGLNKMLLVKDDVAVGIVSLVAEVVHPIYFDGLTSTVVTESSMSILSTGSTGQKNSFVQTWAFDAEPSIQCVVHWDGNAITPKTSRTNISSLVNATIMVERRTLSFSSSNDTRKTIFARVSVIIEPTDASGMEPSVGVAFTTSLNAWTLNPEFDVRGVQSGDALMNWGTMQMLLLPDEITAGFSVDPSTGVRVAKATCLPSSAVPVISFRGDAGGIMAMTDPRSAFALRVDRGGLGMSRIFFLPSHVSQDAGYFNGDVNTTYSFQVALIDTDSDWSDQYAVYVEANPWMQDGPKLSPRGTMTAFGSGNYAETLPSSADVTRIADQRTAMSAMTLNEFWPVDTQTPKLASGNGLKYAKEHGVKVFLWSNVRMSPNVSMVPYEDKLLDFRQFNDSWMLNGSGYLEPCWDGYSMNPSTKFSFGRYQLQRFIDTIKTYNLSGLFFDFYGDTVDSDVCRTYEQFPFYPLQVAETEFIKAVSLAVQSNGGTLVINCPENSMQVRHLAHAVTCDSNGAVNNYSFADSLGHRSAGHPSLILRNILPVCSSSNLLNMVISNVFYGVVPNQWQFMDNLEEQPVADYMLAASLPLAFRLADMVPAGGSFLEGLWWAMGHQTHASSAAITMYVSPDSPSVTMYNVSLSPRVKLDNAETMSVLLWDGVGTYTQLITGADVDLSYRHFRVLVAPGVVKALLYLPSADAVELTQKWGFM